MEEKVLRKALTIGLFVLLLLLSAFNMAAIADDYSVSSLSEGNMGSLSDVLFVGDSGPNNYTRIQDAIDNASAGDTVFVYDDSSPYYENIVINKSICLVGENRETTVIDGNKKGDVVRVDADEVVIKGFTLRNSGRSGIECYGCELIITDNIITQNGCGIDMVMGLDNVVSHNVICDNSEYGILYGGENNVFKHNLIINDHVEVCGYRVVVFGNTFRNESVLEITGTHNKVRYNNFMNGSSAGFTRLWWLTTPPSFNNWNRNYWEGWPGLVPKPIWGERILFLLAVELFIPIPWVHFDWCPLMSPRFPQDV